MQYRVLDRVRSPKDLRGLSEGELRELAAELRRLIIDVISHTGGHLAPSLGVVELTLALHLTFDSPRDKIIWDVGHQSYAHKIITGRRDEFSTIRRQGGLSGYPKREESPHDSFGTGHSSTSISAALGMAVARDLAGDEHRVVAVIGDGALTAGMAFEALNNAGERQTDLVVVLNDNSMAIAPNVGAFPAYLSRLRTEPVYHRVRGDLERLVRRIPRIGESMVNSLERVKDSLKYLVLPGMLFEEMGFTYLGPVDGHDIRSLRAVLRRAGSLTGPVLVHVVTVKGKGYKPAEDDPSEFHGTGPFDVATARGLKKADRLTYTQVFGRTMIELAERFPNMVAITAAMPDGTGLSDFAARFENRFFDVGIAEQHAVTFAAGLSTMGVRPVVAIYSTFLQRAYDQVLHDVALQRLPVIFALDRAGIVGADGETHQGLFDLAYLRHIPGLVVMAPKDENELRSMLHTAMEYTGGPVAIRYPRGPGHGVSMAAEPDLLPLGEAEMLVTGRDVALVALGHPAGEAEKAALLLRERGISAAVLNARFVAPLDERAILRLARSVPLLVTVEEHILSSGFGSAVLELLHRSLAPAEIPRVERLGVPDRFLRHGDQAQQRALFGLEAQGLAERVIEWLEPRRESGLRG